MREVGAAIGLPGLRHDIINIFINTGVAPILEGCTIIGYSSDGARGGNWNDGTVQRTCTHVSNSASREESLERRRSSDDGCPNEVSFPASHAADWLGCAAARSAAIASPCCSLARGGGGHAGGGRQGGAIQRRANGLAGGA